MIIDSTIEICPSPSDSDLCFIHASRSADRLSIATPAFLELWYVATNPPQDCGVGSNYSGFDQHLRQIQIAGLIRDVPLDAEDDDRAVEVTTMK